MGFGLAVLAVSSPVRLTSPSLDSPLNVVSALAVEAAQLRIDPPYVDLGSFSVVDLVQTRASQATPRIEVTSDTPWELHLTILTPPRRFSDAVEHPLLDRLRQSIPTLPRELFQQQSFTVERGNAGMETLIIPTALWETLLLDNLSEADPPGIYRTELRCAITTPDGIAIAEPVVATLQFEIDAWLEVVTPGGDAYVHAGGTSLGPTFTESTAIPVVVHGNTAWQLRVRSEGDLLSPEGNTLPLHQLQIEIESANAGGAWQPLVPTGISVGEVAQALAEGPSPAPFSPLNVEIPVRVSYEPQFGPTVGVYGTTLQFEAVPRAQF